VSAEAAADASAEAAGAAAASVVAGSEGAVSVFFVHAAKARQEAIKMIDSFVILTSKLMSCSSTCRYNYLRILEFLAQS
jgi:hypothetical protein